MHIDEPTLLKALDLGESKDWEFKSAKGGIPQSLWETYSAMANTDGGAIVLGVEETHGEFSVSGLDDPPQARKAVWDTVNNRGKISANLLTEGDVCVLSASGHPVLVLKVPRAARRQRPVYVGQNPLTGAYRRNYEGNYRCSEDEVGRMLADRAEDPADSRILDGFGLPDLDDASVQQYRQRFSARSPTHPWLAFDLQELLMKLGGWRLDRTTGREGLTLAGLLMFGKVEAIMDPHAVPGFQLDYRERLSDDPQVRWSDRITVDGTWVANVFQFYLRVISKLTADLKIPFRLEADLFRRDDTVVHGAIREACVNALIHADFQGQGGIVIERYRNRIELSNPGSLLVSFEQLLRGGISECRNKSLQTMFLMLGIGERAGSGIDSIRQGWNSQQWRSPSIQERLQPDRVSLVLPMVSLLPEESLERLRRFYGGKFGRLGALEVQALVTAETEQRVTNARMQEIAGEHPADLTRVLQALASRGYLVQEGQKRGASYRLPDGFPSVRSGLLHKPGSSSHKGGESSHMPEDLTADELAKLRVIAAAARGMPRLPKEETRRTIEHVCKGRFLTAVQLGELLNRNPNSLRNRFLTPMVEQGVLVRRYPDEPNRPDQAYASKPRPRR